MGRHAFPQAGLALALALALPGAATARGPGAAPISSVGAGPCARAIGSAEQVWRLPGQLLQAIALAESGRRDGLGGERIAWPWTVTAGGKGRFFATKEAAIAHVRRLRARGVRSIDVGCMQVNLQHHPDAFASLNQAFDPPHNAAYAASLLDRLRKSTRSLSRAVARYHSADRARGRPYRRRVYALWTRARLRAYRRARAERTAADRGRNAERIASAPGPRRGP